MAKRSRSNSRSRKSHPDVEFYVSSNDSNTSVRKTFAEAGELVLSALVTSGKAQLDVIVFSEKGARWLGGNEAVEQYREDPEASVFDRFTFKANNVGRVP